MRTFKIKIKNTSKEEFDDVITIETTNKMVASNRYWELMKGNYYFGCLAEVIDGKEKNLASFCKSKFAK